MASNMMTMSISKSVDVKKDSTAGKSQDSSNSISTTFSDILKQYHSNQTSQQTQNQDTVKDNSSVSTTSSSEIQTDKTKDTAYMKEKSTSTVSVRQGDENTVTDKDTEDELENYQSKVEAILQNYLGVSQEQIQQTMQSLNLSTSDLLNTNNLATLVSALSGGSDMGSLLLNENFQGIFTEVSVLNQNLCKELGVSMEELTQMLEQNTQKKQNSSINALAMGNETTEQPVAIAEQAQSQNQTELEQPTEITAVKDQVVAEGTVKLAASTAAGPASELKTPVVLNADGQAEEPVTDSLMTKLQNSAQNQNAMNDGTDGDNADSGTGNQKTEFTEVSKTTVTENQTGQIAGTDTQTFRSTLQSVQTEQPVPVYQTSDLENLVSQLTENAKMQLNQTGNITSMEMQLNPEHLGKLYLHISEKEGVVHAQIAASNEAVKEALASQAADLKQSLNQQGIKVQAIEITVATHQFEQNLEGNQQGQLNQNQQEQSQSERRSSLRADFSESENGLTEAEDLAVRMMQENGNEVDLMA